MNYIELEKIKQKALEDHIPIIMDDTLEVIEKYLKNFWRNGNLIKKPYVYILQRTKNNKI